MTIDMREERAAERAREERVRPIRLDKGRYLVASSTHGGHGYVVYVDTDGTVVCSCPAAQWEFPCKHAAAVRDLEMKLAS
ncbi:MAG TPA: SWIM zinc finger family protein [Chloroflexota bacterium]|nr:SWIM zinc finger family protein [Chloroflexota bacterium]